VQIDTTRCTGCGRCVAACPPAVLCLQPLGWVKTAALHASGCTGCARCVAVCPFDAVHTLRRGPK
jgi:ferredoxin